MLKQMRDQTLNAMCKALKKNHCHTRQSKQYSFLSIMTIHLFSTEGNQKDPVNTLFNSWKGSGAH